MPISEPAPPEFECPSECQPSPLRDSPVFSVPAALQGVDHRLIIIPVISGQEKVLIYSTQGCMRWDSKGTVTLEKKTKTMSML